MQMVSIRLKKTAIPLGFIKKRRGDPKYEPKLIITLALAKFTRKRF